MLHFGYYRELLLSMSTSELIYQYKDHILQQWLTTVREQISGAEELETLALQDDIPDLLDDLAAGLDESSPATVTHESIDHGRMRAKFETYTLSQMIREYRLLLQVVLSFADERIQITPKARNKIIRGITLAMEQAAEAFLQIRQEEDGNAKRAAEALVEELRREGQFRDDFIGTLTHDLRNPLANTFSLVELLRNRMPEDPIFEKIVNAMQQSLNQADILIRNLLDANLIKSGGELPIHRKHSNLMQEVRDSVESFSSEYEAGLVFDSDLPALLGEFDCQALRRALDNLINNAIKYGNQGKVITVKCEPIEGNKIQLSVHNHGNPIPADQQGKIFSRYYRMEEKQANRGWGMGLTLVKGIAEAHGGSVEVVSTPTEGTTFFIRIPSEAH